MASLWSLLYKGKADCENDKCNLKDLVPDLIRESPLLVNATETVTEIMRRGDESIMGQSLDATPGHPWLWLEYIYFRDQLRRAILVHRASRDLLQRDRYPFGFKNPVLPEGTRHVLFMAGWEENQGYALLRGMSYSLLDALGQPIQPNDIGAEEFLFTIANGFDEEDDAWIHCQSCIACEVLTIMNTRGTRVDPSLEHHAGVVKPNRRPHSVWHTIHLPKFASPPLENGVVDGPVLEKREHWVRAHRADYRDGNGLFGRVKALIWVPEHKRGNPELGTVKQSFKVHPQ